jgi:predicted permease
MLRTYARLRTVEPGLDPRGVLTMEVTLPAARYPTFKAVGAFYEELTTRVRAVPGVRSVGLATALPLAGAEGCNGVFVEDQPVTAEPVCVGSITASPEYFRTLAIPVRGRVPGWSDVNRRSGEVVVTRALAERLWPGQDPLGKGLRGRSWGRPFYRVVGVAEDVRAAGLDQPPLEAVFYPMLPLMEAPLWSPPHSMSLVVRSDGGADALAASVRGIVAGMDVEVPIANVRTMEALLARSMASISFTLLLLGIAAAAALTLGALGLYGVLSYAVGQRRTELAIRIALGAPRRQVAGLVVLQSVALVLGGVALGLAGAVATTRVLRSLLFETTATDPGVLLAAALILLGISLVATLVPVRRALRVDPMVTLRHE